MYLRSFAGCTGHFWRIIFMMLRFARGLPAEAEKEWQKSYWKGPKWLLLAPSIRSTTILTHRRGSCERALLRLTQARKC